MFLQFLLLYTNQQFLLSYENSRIHIYSFTLIYFFLMNLLLLHLLLQFYFQIKLSDEVILHLPLHFMKLALIHKSLLKFRLTSFHLFLFYYVKQNSI
jgi:hypothetical protein